MLSSQIIPQNILDCRFLQIVDKKDLMIQAMLKLDIDQIVQLLNQGVSPTLVAIPTEATKEKIAAVLIERFFNKTCCFIFLNGLESEQLNQQQQDFKHKLLQEPNRYSEQEVKAVCLDILRNNLSKNLPPLNIVNIAFLTANSALIEKLVELGILDATLSPSKSPHTIMYFKLFSPKPDLKLFENLIEKGYSLSEICDGSNGSDLEQALKLYLNFLPTENLVYNLFLN